MKHVKTFESFLNEAQLNEEVLLKEQTSERIIMALDATSVIYRSEDGHKNDLFFFKDLGKYFYKKSKPQKNKWVEKYEISLNDLTNMIEKLLPLGKFYKNQ